MEARNHTFGSLKVKTINPTKPQKPTTKPFGSLRVNSNTLALKNPRA